MCDKIDFELCRLCLNSGGILINIFDENNKLEIMLEKTIEDLIDVKVVEEADCPWFVCSNCMEKLTEFRLFKRRCTECLFVFYNRIQKGSNPSTKDWITNSEEAQCKEEGAVPSDDDLPEDEDQPEEELDNGTSASVWAISSTVGAVDDSVQVASNEMEEDFSDVSTRVDSTASIGEKTRFPSGIKEEVIDEGIEVRAVGVGDDEMDVNKKAVNDGGFPATPDNDTPSPSMQEDDSHWTDDEDRGNMALEEDTEVDVAMNIKEEFSVVVPQDDGATGGDTTLMQGHQTSSINTDLIGLSSPYPCGELKSEPLRTSPTSIASVKQVDSVNEPLDEINERHDVLVGHSVAGRSPVINDRNGRLSRHQQRVPVPPGEQISTVDRDGIVSETVPSLSRQSLTVDLLKGQAFQCAVCGYVFASKGLVENHMKVHIDSQFFHCETCFIGFSKRSEYDAHMLSHRPTISENGKREVEREVVSGNGNVNLEEKSARGVLPSGVSREAPPSVVDNATEGKMSSGVQNRSDLSAMGNHSVGGAGSSTVLLLGNCGVTTVIIPPISGGKSGQVSGGHCGSVQQPRGIPIRPLTKAKVVKDDQSFVCDVCGRCYGRNIQLRAHMRAHRPKSYACKSCPKTFPDRLSFNRHRHMHLVEEKPFKCSVCSKGFPHKQALNLHMSTHTGAKPFVCKVCSKAFSQGSNLRTHMTVHSDERPHVCDICSKGFSLKQSLMIHRRTHTGERPYCCKLCSRSFSRSCHLSMHMARHRGEKHHKCAHCDKAFIDKGDLTKHMRVHTKERPYRCKYCPNVYSHVTMLNRHTLLHTGETRLSCGVCSKKFTSKSTYTAHMYKHTVGGESFKCDVCSKGFPTKQELSAHIVTNGREYFKCYHCSYATHRKSNLRNHIEGAHGEDDDLGAQDA